MPLNEIKGTLTRRLRRIRHPGTVPSLQEYHSKARKPGHLRLLSFNIQVGINTQQYRHYLTRSWQHVLPNARRIKTLDQIASTVSDFDLVALQEVDGGSLRSGFVNQTEYLALRAGFPFWYQQLNRNLGKLAQHSNGLLSRYRPGSLEDHKLPGLIPGRGAIISHFGNEESPLVVVMMHLALSHRARNLQLSYLKDVIDQYDHVVLMGDMNTHAEQLLNNSPLKNSALVAAHAGMGTFPSWRPRKSLDHILVSPSLDVQRVGVLNFPMSDHLPVAVDIKLPDSINLIEK
ncbi:endonuclease [Endozoicomonas sp. OPT23]|uniref:endonuclease/exonuclease/phosphatase family protein n=1 Tax=Endozoicomonas sp. OPT23 TaxID=2072845 RepID=UPI00129B3F6C|nr:endonuclease/exonuclease/phosphatase family protein [Endozoicomonas sp. OPT23]MRI33324.1 endonuclease [Endozoicomonas sp. OPT23]